MKTRNEEASAEGTSLAKEATGANPGTQSGRFCEPLQDCLPLLMETLVLVRILMQQQSSLLDDDVGSNNGRMTALLDPGFVFLPEVAM